MHANLFNILANVIVLSVPKNSETNVDLFKA